MVVCGSDHDSHLSGLTFLVVCRGTLTLLPAIGTLGIQGLHGQYIQFLVVCSIHEYS